MNTAIQIKEKKNDSFINEGERLWRRRNRRIRKS